VNSRPIDGNSLKYHVYSSPFVGSTSESVYMLSSTIGANVAEEVRFIQNYQRFKMILHPLAMKTLWV
jgi:hypothetical protein